MFSCSIHIVHAVYTYTLVANDAYPLQSMYLYCYLHTCPALYGCDHVCIYVYVLLLLTLQPYNVYLCKLSNISSEQAFHNYLQSFMNSLAKVMVLVSVYVTVLCVLTLHPLYITVLCVLTHHPLYVTVLCVLTQHPLYVTVLCVFTCCPLYVTVLCVLTHRPLYVTVLCVHTHRPLQALMVMFSHIDQVINMQETKKQMVNHIRIMVEQAEGNPLHPHVSTAPQGTRDYCLWRSIIICTPLSSLQKLFVLLLHFPPSMFYDRCYPALFLNGWDHHYFDSLQPEPEGIVDIRYVQ